ncbi:MAG: hypothetical protein IJ091_06220 [Oscillospiraceae bacterium]|nr:hypothetical protein [Oscillospiraceae bacterium]
MKLLKKLLAFLTAGTLLCSCSLLSSTEITGHSEIYSETDLQAAASAVENEFKHMKAGTLHHLNYAGDAACADTRSLNEEYRKKYTAYIIFDSSFTTPPEPFDAFEPNTEYTWNWVVARDWFGFWKVVDFGYC